MLEEPGPVALDARQRVEVAQQLERVSVRARLLAGELVDERLEHDPLDVRVRGADHVVLAEAEHLGGVDALVDAALEPAGHRGQHVLLAPGEHLELVALVEQVRVVVALAALADGHHVAHPLQDRAGVGPLQHSLDGGGGDEPDHADLVEVLEGVLVVGEQALRDQLHQDRVVALEGGEHVGVGLQRVEPVDREVAGAATGLAALLDRPGRVPGAERLRAGGTRLERAPGELRVPLVLDVAEHLVQVGRDALLREVQRVGAGQQREQPALVHAVVEQQLLGP